MVQTRPGADHAQLLHDLRTPLNGMSGVVQLLELHLADRKSQDLLALARECCVEMERLLDSD